MTHLRRKMLEELERRNYSDRDDPLLSALQSSEFAQHFGKSPDKLGLEHLRSYSELTCSSATKALPRIGRALHISALRFFFVRTLHRHQFRQASSSPIPGPAGSCPTS